MKKRMLAVAAGALAALLLAVPGFAAAPSDVNNDGLPDRWEKRHDLSLNVNQAGRDQDRDGLRNKGEFKRGSDPREADTDGDGEADGEDARPCNGEGKPGGGPRPPHGPPPPAEEETPPAS